MNRNFYLKKLGSQELGSPKPDGTVSRGRYFYITKSYENFFPYLSNTITNDNILLPIILEDGSTKVYTTLVYHNDKFTNPGFGTRDEFRLYLNKYIDPNRSYFQPNDIVVFEKYKSEDSLPLYVIHRFSEGVQNYQILNDIIENSPIRGGHALIDNLDFINEVNTNIVGENIIIPEEVLNIVETQQSEVLMSHEGEIEHTRGSSLFNSDSFREFVLHAYEYKCAITNQSISYKNFYNLEAAHIKPKAQDGTFLPCNGIAMCRDMHWAFDKGLITISDNYDLIVHDKVNNELLDSLKNKKIFLPKVDYFKPEKTFLKHHNENIFGLFLYSGSIRSL